MDMNSSLKNRLKENVRQYGMITALIVIILFFQVITGGILLKPLNVTNIVLQNSYILILAVGMLPVILIGKFDMGVGSIAGFVGAVAAILVVNYKMPFLPVLLIGLLIGGLAGAWQGLWISYIGVPAFIVTLSTMLIFRGFTIAILDGRSIGPFSEAFQALSSSFLPDIFNSSGMHLTTVLLGIIGCVVIAVMQLKKRADRIKYEFEVLPMSLEIAQIALMCFGVLLLTYFFAAYKGLPTVMILVLFLIILYTFITSKTVLGRRLYAIGGNEKAAALSGIKTKFIHICYFYKYGCSLCISRYGFRCKAQCRYP